MQLYCCILSRMIWFDSHFDMMVWIRRSLETNWRAERMAFSFLSSLVALLKELLRRFPLYLVAEWSRVEAATEKQVSQTNKNAFRIQQNFWDILHISNRVLLWGNAKIKILSTISNKTGFMFQDLVHEMLKNERNSSILATPHVQQNR